MDLGSRKGLDDILDKISGKRILMRVDYNVPVKEGKVKDTTRIVATKSTIEKILSCHPKVLVLMSHLGRPDGNRSEKDSLKPAVAELEKIIKKPVKFLNDCVGEEILKTVNAAHDGEVILLENLRFHPEEEGAGVTPDGKKIKPEKEAIQKFRDQLTSLGDIYLNDAFGTAHRAHSSMAGINLPIKAAGYLLKKEMDYFSKALEKPTRPLLVILGGAKVKDKIKLINNILEIANEIIIGGGMAFTFLKVLHNMKIGKSLYDEEGANLVKGIMEKAQTKGVKVHLPVDFLCGDKFAADCNKKHFTIKTGIEDNYGGYDIGEETIKHNAEVISHAKTILWNGPQGVFEMEPFKKGSVAILEKVIEATSKGTISIVGGGDTVALVQSIPGAESKISHVSTGGGASLELLEGAQLPGVTFLDKK